MTHITLASFWKHYAALLQNIQQLADRQFDRLKADPFHPSLHFKKVGRHTQLWAARVGIDHRALGLDKPEGVLWTWIGTHAEYDRLLA